MVAVRRARIALAGMLALLIGLGPRSAVGASEFLDFYKLGLAAVEAADWEVAAEMMQKAIDRQPEAKARVTKALYFRRYLPYFYLGKALYASGDCQGALAAWTLSEAQGVVARFPELEELNAGRASCRQRRSDLESAREAALGAIQRAISAAVDSRRSVEMLGSSSQAVRRLRMRQDRAERMLAETRSQLQGGHSAVTEIEAAAAVAGQSRREFESIRVEAQRQRSLLVSRQEQLISELETLVESSREILSDSEHLAPYPREISRWRAAVGAALDKAGSLEAELSLDELDVLKSELETAISGLRDAVSPPPRELIRAAEAFLSGDYRSVLAILGGSSFSSTRAASQAHLLKAAALFTLFHASDGSEPELLERAREEVLDFRAADPVRLPPSSVFSPRFVRFFENQTASGGTADSAARDVGR